VRKVSVERVYTSVDNALNHWAKEIAKDLPKDKKIIVMNFEGPGYYTQLGRYLGDRIENYLSKEKVSMINRRWGEEAYEEERKYMAEPEDESALKELLEKFQADIAVFGKYELTESFIDFQKIQAVGTRDAKIVASADVGKVNVTPEMYNYYKNKEEKVIWESGLEREIPWFVKEEGKWDAIDKVSLITQNKEIIEKFPSISIGTYYKVKIELNRTPAYIYILGWDKDNNISTLLYPIVWSKFPEPYYEPVMQGIDTLPKKQYYKALSPAGYNYVVVIATKEELKLDFKDSWYEKSIPAEALNLFEQQIKKLGKENWGSMAVEFWIRAEICSKINLKFSKSFKKSSTSASLCVIISAIIYGLTIMAKLSNIPKVRKKIRE
jgi:hypothetical protein